ncbi:pre-mycofactocin synthase MftD [Burkholderia sp. Ax-1719]|uniref:pre-mycofactocin synthase MftD n=1 Tax=Burkholderia sp. Ax-1719 TaxID=2608334 RepID=UPI00141EB7F5|nr:pre-mycofactocin synthase MftD [Burkholderia sp. Ax-1719]NIE66899.1 mycofactocin biosynthesis FMN-dependent deaminase MftD [Burkholderia sp. Ax-1719]
MAFNPWKENAWFESVAVAKQRARKRLPEPVYMAIVAGSERGKSVSENEQAFEQLGVSPKIVGQTDKRDLSTTVLGTRVELPVLISPTGVQAVHPDGEIAVARAAAARGTVMGLSNFASKPVEQVCAVNDRTFFQMYWSGSRDVMIQRMTRAHEAGAKALIVTLDWSFSMGRDWGSPEIPERVNLRSAIRFAPKVLTKPGWLWRFMQSGGFPDLTVPNLASSVGGDAPTFFGAYYEWMTTPPPTWDDVAWMCRSWKEISGKPFVIKGIGRVDDARRAVDAGVDAISVSNHGGNNLDCTPAPIRLLRPIVDAVGEHIEVYLDGGVRRGSDVAKALALGARAVLIGRAYLWGLSANGQAGVENVLDVMRSGLDSTLRGLAIASVADLRPEHLLIPDGFVLSMGE